MGVQQPFLYPTESRDSRAPAATFDPKAVTRASYTPKQPKPKQDGPLLSFNRHPDAHMVLSYRSNNYTSMSPWTKGAIKWIRRLQLLLRILELNAAIGLLVLMILITDVDALQAWVMRITAGAVIVLSLYAIYHLSRSPSSRPPASSAAYQLFAGLSDLAVMPLYAYGALAVRNDGSKWHTRLAQEDIIDVFIPTVYYLYISAGGMHFLSLCFSAWLGWMFRKISLMPPDMNPLESHLTSRAKHKRNKSSMATTSTMATDDPSEKRLSTPMESHRRSGVPYEDLSRPPTIPFLQTRGSRDSISTRDSRLDLPSRQYQVTPGNSPRNSAHGSDFKRMALPRFSQHARGSYTELPSESGSSRPNTSRNSVPPTASPAAPSRTAKFSETWTPSDSLISRTQQRNRAMNAATERDAGPHQRDAKSYEALSQRYSFPESDPESDDDENNLAGSDFENDLANSDGSHPNPLRSNPPRTQTPFHPRASVLSDISLNERQAGSIGDIADEKPQLSPPKPWQRNRNSSIQPESDFYSKPYGELKAATPPIIVGSNRQVSSGNDVGTYSSAYGRRNVSGKAAEEGLAGVYSKYKRNY